MFSRQKVFLGRISPGLSRFFMSDRKKKKEKGIEGEKKLKNIYSSFFFSFFLSPLRNFIREILLILPEALSKKLFLKKVKGMLNEEEVE